MKDDRSRSICLLQTINRNMRRCVEKKVAGTGVFRSQHKLLMTLGNHQDCSQTELAEKLEAPVALGTRAGVIAYYFNGKKLGELPVTAAEAVERAGYKDHLQKVFKSWISIRRTAA